MTSAYVGNNNCTMYNNVKQVRLSLLKLKGHYCYYSSDTRGGLGRRDTGKIPGGPPGPVILIIIKMHKENKSREDRAAFFSRAGPGRLNSPVHPCPTHSPDEFIRYICPTNSSDIFFRHIRPTNSSDITLVYVYELHSSPDISFAKYIGCS